VVTIAGGSAAHPPAVGPTHFTFGLSAYSCAIALAFAVVTETTARLLGSTLVNLPPALSTICWISEDETPLANWTYIGDWFVDAGAGVIVGVTTDGTGNGMIRGCRMTSGRAAL
jgi:hypothetical protein